MRERGMPVVLTGGPEDRDVASRVAEGVDIIDLAGRTGIADAMEIVRGARLVVCNDSMVLHLASAFKRPTVAVFCATAPALGFGPWKNDRAVVVERDLPCRPCSPHGTRKCPNGSNACMMIGADEVMAAIEMLEVLP
jgi:heptosyltransferase-2